MAQTKNEKVAMAYVRVPRNVYEGLTAEAVDEEQRAREFSFLMSNIAVQLFMGGKLLPADLTRHISGIIDKPDFQPLEIIPALQRGMSKTPDGRTVLQIEVDQAFVETLKIWARAGGHEDDWEEYVTRAFAHVMHMGWLAGVPTDAIQLQFTPADFAALRELCAVPDGNSLTGTDVIDFIRSQMTPEPTFVEAQP